MEHINKSIVFKLVSLGAIIAFTIVLFSQLDTRTKIVFCDVGQGDAAYIRVVNKIDILIDAGSNEQILSCLGKHMPFYDREIELAFITHPQKDHYGGFIPILERYRIKTMAVSLFEADGQNFNHLKDLVRSRKVLLRYINRGDSIKIHDSYIKVLWPTKQVLGTYKGHGQDPNYFSQVVEFSEGTFRALFTGDMDQETQVRLSAQPVPRFNILKVPHHGSKNGLTAKFLSLANPEVSVISVGKKNSYGHPNISILDMLRAQGSKIRRTDLEGDIVFKIN